MSFTRRRFLGTGAAMVGAAGLRRVAAEERGMTDGPGGRLDDRTPAGSPGRPRGTAAPVAPDGDGHAEPEPFELEEATVAELQRSMERGDRTARSIVSLYLDRIEALDRQGPELRAIIETNPGALEIADRLDAERRASGPRGPLHGIPVVLKDNLGTHDGMTTTAGSLALEGSVPAEDSTVARKLREAGAVLLAKANLSEWAFFRGERATSGWSARGGQCRNPYALDRNPCGSSSGSSVAVAANLATLAVGTETGGSILCPASANGGVGMKPTVGLWSRSGIVPLSRTWDSAGPMTRTVRDAAVLLGVAAGVDPRDDATAASAEHVRDDYTRFLDPAGLEGTRVGVARVFPRFDPFPPSVLNLFEEALEAMESAGAVLVDPAEVPAQDGGDGLYGVVLEYEFRAGINAYLRSLGADAPIRSLNELIEFNERNREREMPHFGQERLVAARARGPLSDETYRRALRTVRRRAREEGIDAVMEERHLDVIAAPTAGPAWLTDHVLGDRPVAGFSGRPAAIAGYPNVTVPMGFVEGLPVGLSFFGGAWSEPTLLRASYAYERVTGHRSPPRFPPTVG